MRPAVTWVLVADGARASIFVHDGPGSGLRPVHDHEFAASTRAPNRAATSDRPGRTFDSAGAGRHAYAETDWREAEKQRFAKMMAEELCRGAERKAFDRLVLVAPPQTLGDLRVALDKNTARLVAAEINKDLTHLDANQLPEHLAEAMKP